MQLRRVVCCIHKPEHNRFDHFAATKPHAKAPRASADNSTSIQQGQVLPLQRHAFQKLRTHTQVCLADIAQPHHGYNALIAAADIKRSQTVLHVRACNSLCVPISDSVYRWECDWLDPFEAVHGRLPGALSYYLAGRSGADPQLQCNVLSVHAHSCNHELAAPSKPVPTRTQRRGALADESCLATI